MGDYRYTPTNINRQRELKQNLQRPSDPKDDDSEKRQRKIAARVLAICSLVIGVLTALFSAYMISGIITGDRTGFFSAITTLKNYAGLVLVINSIALLMGIFGLMADFKRIKIAAVVLTAVMAILTFIVFRTSL
jgi:uncharacterized membrane protein (UPF0136 family)